MKALIYIGCIEQVKPAKGKVIVVDDHAYREFVDNAYLPYLKPNQIPVTWGIQPGRLGTVIPNTGTLLSKEDIDELSNDPYSEFSWHTWDSTETSNMGVNELRAENHKCITSLRKMGVLPEHFWRCAWKQNLAQNAMYCKDDVSAFAYWKDDAEVQLFPFVDKYNIGRFGIHYYSQSEIDDIFEYIRKAHNIYIFYTHSCLNDVSQAGAGSITPTQAEYFAQKCKNGIDEGWLECVTYNQLCVRYND